MSNSRSYYQTVLIGSRRIFEVSSGCLAGTVADPKLIFGCALKAAASGIILAHNYPSGALHPSHADVDLTKKLNEGENKINKN